MDAAFPFLLVLTLALSGLFGGPSGRGGDGSAAKAKLNDVSPLQEKEKEKEIAPILCTWIAYGKQQSMCLREEMSVAQKKCNDFASKELGEPVQCSCTGDQSYIQDACN